jgi:CCR4-NOT transcription complex subunit 7/8
MYHRWLLPHPYYLLRHSHLTIIPSHLLLCMTGIVFDNLTRDGIDVRLFGELLTSSGLVLSDDVCWISFHSGYDFGYLLKVLTAKALPGVEDEFFKLLQTFFPKIYDIKHLMRNCDNKLKGGLNKVAEDLLVPRIGPMHQAGSDSLLTASTFFKMRESFFAADDLTDPRWVGVLYGYGPGKEDRERR